MLTGLKAKIAELKGTAPCHGIC